MSSVAPLLPPAALLLAAIASRMGRRAAPWLALGPAALFGLLLLSEPVASGAVPWVPSLGVEVAWRLDGLSRLLALLITGIGAFVVLYAARYMRDDPKLHRFLATLMLFMAAMLGAVLADDLILLFVFWELTSLASFLLIGFKAEKSEARKAAQQGLLVTVGGGLALLAAILLLGAAAGTFRISALTERPEALLGHAFLPWIVVLLAIGCFAKSAQWPLHFWLPNAMAAPTPVSAYLHSATMVKLGVYLLARLNPLFQSEPLWQGLLTGAGAMTMVTGALLALRERDLKRKLAWSTIVALGTLVTLIGLADPLAATAAVAFLLVHALYKACLFLVSGIVDHAAGTRDALVLRGLGRRMPLTALAAGLAALSMAGAPGFVGYLAKDLVFTAQLGVPGLLPAVALAANAAMVVVAGVVAARPFLGQLREDCTAVGEAPAAMLAGPIVLAMLGLLFGLAPWLVAGSVIEPAAAAILGRPTGAVLGDKVGGESVLYLSVGVLGLGLVAYLGWTRLQPTLARQAWLDAWGPDAIYGRALRGLSRIAAWQTGRIQHGSLRGYLGFSLAVMFGGALVALATGGGLAMPGWTVVPGWHHLALVLLVATGVVAACLAGDLLTQVMAAAIVGFGAGILFLALGAPDLAFTQFTVEAISIVLLVAVLARLPFRKPDARRREGRARDAALALGVGAAGALVLLAVLAVPFSPHIPEWMGQAAVPEAKGRNVVNVVIVDFRALDTLGEIAVLAVAALAAAVLFHRVRGRTTP
jgi:multicomponent Na+:H+ antiporter subunit A